MAPAGFKRSRALWDETQRPHDTIKQKLQCWLRAILYELQPIRFSQINNHTTRSNIENIYNTLIYIISSLPYWTSQLILFLKGRTSQQWKIVAGIIVYFYFVRFIHDLLDAGPMVIIITALVGIFTIGLGDNQYNDGHQNISAYSVFNRGFERLLGSVDADSLLAQHVGGGAGMIGLGGMVAAPGGGNNNNNNNHHDNNNNNNRHRRHLPRDEEPPREAVARRPENNNNNFDDSGDENENNNDNNNGGQSRKSGKKARRRNLEQRREIRRQREAAMELGDAGTEQEMIAMQRVIEEQIRAENQQNG